MTSGPLVRLRRIDNIGRLFTEESDMAADPTDIPETEEVLSDRVSCDGGGGALGHPRVWMTIGGDGWVECGYCDKRFVLAEGAGGH